MYCEKCNERIEKNWVFCPMCGNRIERIKINLSNTTVLREGTLRSLDYNTYTCRDVDLCSNVDCDDCVFGRDDIFTLEEIKKRLIKRGDDPKEAERRVSHDNDDFKGIENEVDKIVYNNENDTIDGAVQKILKYMSEVKG